jgi:hypothetical protein
MAFNPSALESDWFACVQDEAQNYPALLRGARLMKLGFEVHGTS